MAEKCVFNPKLSLGIIEKGFNKSFGEGVTATKNEAVNLYTNIKERFAPQRARFDQVAIYEYKDGRMYWQSDSMPVGDHLRRFTLMLGVQGASPDWIDQAKKDEQVQEVVQDHAKNLKPGQAITYLSKKDPDTNKGVSLQQIINVNGVLIHQSHLLPFNDIDQINSFINLASCGKGDLSLDDDISGWIVTGDKIDFDKDLPEMMIKSMVSEQASLNEPQMPQVLNPTWPQLAVVSNLDISRGLDVSDRVSSVEPSSFWWQLLANKVTDLSLVSQSVVVEADIVGPDPTEQLRQTVEEMNEIVLVRQSPVKVETVVSSTAIFEKPARMNSAGKDKKQEKRQTSSRVPTTSGRILEVKAVKRSEKKTLPKNYEVKTEKPMVKPTSPPASQERELRAGMNLEGKKVQSKTESQSHSGTINPSGSHPEGKKEPQTERQIPKAIKEEKVVFQTQTKRPKERVIKVERAVIPPIFQLPRLNLEPQVFNENEIPVWQMTLDDASDENNAIAFLIVTTFFLIVNTKWLRSDGARGSGSSLVRTVFNAS
jgi:hypothetical protein